MFHIKTGLIAGSLVMTLTATLFHTVDASAQNPSRSESRTLPVLLVVANEDYLHPEYAMIRSALEAQGLDVVVAAAAITPAIPQVYAQSEFQAVKRVATIDVALPNVDFADHSAVVFLGGWGSSMYQYAFEGTYHNQAYQLDADLIDSVNDLIGDFLRSGKPVAAIAQGVSVLAWARVDGVSPLRGRVVVGDAGGIPGFSLGDLDFPDAEVPARLHVELNGGIMLTSRSLGDPMSSSDDVIVDGNIITAENHNAGPLMAKKISSSVGKGGKN